jgi:signal transduction histidine kinase
MGHETLRLANVYLDELIREEGQSAEVLAKTRGICVIVGEIEEAPLRGDGDLLSQMMRNLLSNSIKFTPAGGEIRIDLKRQSSQYIITVQDTGVGIRESAQEQIFDRFYKDNARLVSDDDSAFLGSGLGLSIARWIAEAHRGALTLQSSSSEGSIFTAVLPIR